MMMVSSWGGFSLHFVAALAVLLLLLSVAAAHSDHQHQQREDPHGAATHRCGHSHEADEYFIANVEPVRYRPAKPTARPSGVKEGHQGVDDGGGGSSSSSAGATGSRDFGAKRDRSDHSHVQYAVSTTTTTAVAAAGDEGNNNNNNQSGGGGDDDDAVVVRRGLAGDEWMTWEEAQGAGQVGSLRLQFVTEFIDQGAAVLVNAEQCAAEGQQVDPSNVASASVGSGGPITCTTDDVVTDATVATVMSRLEWVQQYMADTFQVKRVAADSNITINSYAQQGYDFQQGASERADLPTYASDAGWSTHLRAAVGWGVRGGCLCSCS